MKLLLTLLCVAILTLGATAKDPTNYEHYTSGGVKTGLKADNSEHFHLNGKPFVIYGGSLHYFRIVPGYWKATLAKFRAAGLNSVQIYLPWNLHEPRPGHFDFTSPGLNLAHFLEEVKAADMFAIVRIGPFICAEWELGGFPAWLLRDDHLQLRTNYKPYLERVKIYWTEVMKIVNKYQFSTSGGPVIMLQIENEYFSIPVKIDARKEYLLFLHDIVAKSGFKELLFTSDPSAANFPIKDIFPEHDVLETANLNHGAYNTLRALKEKQKNRPAFVSEFWPGWFDEWHDKAHHKYSLSDFSHEIDDILFKVNGSVNFYMFIGGTNFGFMNGDRVVTSYDYDAPLTEAGNYTLKYIKTKDFYLRLESSGRLPKTHLPEVPPAPRAHAYGVVQIYEKLPFEELLKHAPKFTNVKKPITMELLNLDPKKPDHGQSYGWILYRVQTNKVVSDYEIPGTIFDRGIFLVDSQEVATIEEGNNYHFKHHFPSTTHFGHHQNYDVLVENLGRHKFGGLGERKGVSSEIKIDGHPWTNLTIYSLDFDPSFMSKVSADHAWEKVNGQQSSVHSPALYRTTLKVTGRPIDTYLKLDGWVKGNVFVNGFNIGRYWNVGPQKTLYVPAPLLKTGDNVIEVFELHKAGPHLEFTDTPILG